MQLSKTLSMSDMAYRLAEPINRLRQGVDFYNRDFSAYDNDIYRFSYTRVAHWLNFQEQDWFTKRLSYYLDNYSDYDCVIDLGFSVPYVYSRPDIAFTDTSFVFVDKEKSVRPFFDCIIDAYEITREEDQLVIADVTDPNAKGQILSAIRSASPESILIVASEIIEHLESSANAWQLISEIASLSSKTHAYITLPIGAPIPSHHLAFNKIKDARNYLDTYLGKFVEESLWPRDPEHHSPYLRACYTRLGPVLS